MIYAPKVATGLSPGIKPVSTLGTLKINEFALKGREADLIKPASIAAPEIRVPIETCYNWTYLRVVSTFDLPPFRANRSGRRFPGLKPWAESSSPFGARPFGPRHKISRHFVPGCDAERPRPGGTVEVTVSPTDFPHSRHFVLGYQPVPPEQKSRWEALFLRLIVRRLSHPSKQILCLSNFLLRWFWWRLIRFF
jgi:hypothetical protein